MRGRMLALFVAGVLGAALLSAAQAGSDKKGKACPMSGGCPLMVEGAQAQVANIADGVTITITAKDPEAVKKIQEAAASHVKDGKWVCPMCGDKKGCKSCKKGDKKDKKADKKAEPKPEEKK